jgi:cell division protein FtsB
MKAFAIVLLVLLLLLQARLWLSDEGVREVNRLEGAVAAQKEENGTLAARNERLAAEVKDLKEGMAAVEERARSDLGMVGANESFYQVVPPEKASGTAGKSNETEASQQASAR